MTHWIKKKSPSKYMSKKRKEAAGKNLNYSTADDATRKGLDASRVKEWDKWKRYYVPHTVKGKELQDLLRSGHKALGMQWIETDKNASKRVPGGPYVEPLYKSRLVGRGDQEEHDVRSDSPTVDAECQRLILSFAASNKLKVRSADIENAYFQGEPLTRLMLFKQPKGGLPGMDPEEHICARVPVYGTRDAGRGFWKRLRKVCIDAGLKENHVSKAFYHYTVDGDVKLMLGTHVDDLIWAAKPEAEFIIDKIRETFVFGTEDSGTFRYCGQNLSQNDNFDISVDCKDTILRTSPIRIEPGRKNYDEINAQEKTQLKSVAGSLSWVARQCRPDLTYRVSKMQSAASKGTVKDLKDANKVLDWAQSTADRGLVFKHDSVDWNNFMLGVITDASWAGEEEFIPETGENEEYRSQGARLQVIASPEILSGEEATFHLIGYGSNIVKRVCRSTMQAETYTLQSGSEEGDRIRAMIADIFNKLDPKDWEATAAAAFKQIWFTDCYNLKSTLVNPKFTKHADKRLSLEVASMRQSLWRKPGSPKGDPHMDDEMPKEPTDIVRWVDTDVMIADPMTKVMEPDKLHTALDNNRWNFEQPIEAVLKKRAKQLKRKKNAISSGEDHDSMDI